MKKLKSSLLALCVLAGGVMAADAAVGPISGDAGLRDNSYYDTLGKDYDVNIQFNTNNPARLVLVVGLPEMSRTLLVSEVRGAVDTDGGGKIDGAQYATIYWGGQTNKNSNFTTFNVDVSGSVGSRANVPSVRMTMKGLGYDVGSGSNNYNGEAILALNFISGGSL